VSTLYSFFYRSNLHSTRELLVLIDSPIMFLLAKESFSPEWLQRFNLSLPSFKPQRQITPSSLSTLACTLSGVLSSCWTTVTLPWWQQELMISISNSWFACKAMIDRELLVRQSQELSQMTARCTLAANNSSRYSDPCCTNRYACLL
jgi:hypothetical protein